jgi:hypothetical protein
MVFTPFIACILFFILMTLVFVVLAVAVCGVLSIYIVVALFQSLYVGAGGSLGGIVDDILEAVKGACGL